MYKKYLIFFIISIISMSAVADTNITNEIFSEQRHSVVMSDAEMSETVGSRFKNRASIKSIRNTQDIFASINNTVNQNGLVNISNVTNIIIVFAPVTQTAMNFSGHPRLPRRH